MFKGVIFVIQMIGLLFTYLKSYFKLGEALETWLWRVVSKLNY